MRARLALLIAVLLAGCVTPPVAPVAGDGASASGARVACVDGVCNLLATVEPATRQANELSVAVNPTDPRNIIATGKDYTPDEAGDCVWAGIYTTLDGGRTWKNQNVPGSPWKRLKDPTTPVTPFSKFWCATDPVVAFGPDGTAYWTVMPYQCDRASGSKLGRDVHPKGGFNDWMWTCSSMYVLVSTDGGLTWPVDKAREVATGPGIAHDKQWITVSPDGGKVLLCWDYRGADGGLADPLPSGAPRVRLPPVERYAVVCSVSTDKGSSWSKPATATNEGGFPWMDFDANGRAWMAVTDGFREGSIHVLWSDDGVEWSERAQVATFVNGDGSNEYGWPTLRGSAFRVVPYGALAADRTDGHFSGRLYLTWFDHASGRGVTMLSWSDDGATWSAPAAVAPVAADADQFFPVVSVGEDGTVDVSWNDRRDDPDNYLYHTYHAYSVDGGATFSTPLRVSDAPSDEKHSHHQNGMVFLGDYRDMRSTDGRAVMTWVDTRHGKADVMVAIVERPRANPTATAG